MSETNGRGLASWFDNKTIITLVTTAGMIGGQWYAMGAKVDRLNDDIKVLKEDARSDNVRLYTLERELALWGRETEDLRNDLTELRRQSGLTTPQNRAVR